VSAVETSAEEITMFKAGTFRGRLWKALEPLIVRKVPRNSRD